MRASCLTPATRCRRAPCTSAILCRYGRKAVSPCLETPATRCVWVRCVDGGAGWRLSAGCIGHSAARTGVVQDRGSAAAGGGHHRSTAAWLFEHRQCVPSQGIIGALVRALRAMARSAWLPAAGHRKVPTGHTVFHARVFRPFLLRAVSSPHCGHTKVSGYRWHRRRDERASDDLQSLRRQTSRRA